MKLLKGATYLSGLLAGAALARPTQPAARLFLWPFKLTGGALVAILGLVSGLGAMLGLARRDWKMAGAGAAGAALAAGFLQDLPGSEEGFAAAFGPDWKQRIPASLQPRLLPRRWSLLANAPGSAVCQRDLAYGTDPQTGGSLLADLWGPPPGVAPTGLAVIYVHGGAWRIGFKDMGTRTFFRRLAAQGHTILDIEYTLWPKAGIPTMVAEVKEAILWLKGHSQEYGVDPERIVLMGGSAGAHLALLTAYTAGHPSLPPLSRQGDTSVRGVVAFYPPTDFSTLHEPIALQAPDQGDELAPDPLDGLSEGCLTLLFNLHGNDIEEDLSFRDFVPALLGGRPEEIPETYRLLSPAHQVGPQCPPTLLLQGTDDIFGLAPAVRRLHDKLQGAGVASVLVEFPHAEHAFDLVLPRVSPPAQAATYDVERFLALLA